MFQYKNTTGELTVIAMMVNLKFETNIPNGIFFKYITCFLNQLLGCTRIFDCIITHKFEFFLFMYNIKH